MSNDNQTLPPVADRLAASGINGRHAAAALIDGLERVHDRAAYEDAGGQWPPQ